MNGPFGPPPPPPGRGYYGPPPGYVPGSPGRSKMGSGAIVAVFVGVLLALALLAGLVVLFNQPPPPVPPCAPAQPCAPLPSLPPAGSPRPVVTPLPGSSHAPATPGAPGATLPPVQTPASNSPVAVSGTLYTDSSLGYGFEYDPDTFDLGQTTDGSAVLNAKSFDAQVWVDAKSAETNTAQMIQNELSDVDRFLVARVADTDTYDALLGPSIGYVPGDGGVWSGTLTSRDGTPLAPGGVVIVSSSDGRITVAVVVVVGTPDARVGGETQEHQVRSAADGIVKTFHWSIQ